MAEEQPTASDYSGLTDAEKDELRKQGYPVPDERHNTHTFLAKVLKTEDTTKVGNLTEDELGMAKHPVRAFKEFALISDKICEDPLMTEFFNKEAENVLATSLSRNGKLIGLAVIQKRVIEDETKPKKSNTGWFSRKKPEEE
jgi:hypothetical protein